MSIKDKCEALCIRMNTLPVKIFALFWLIFILLMMIAFIIPSFDMRQLQPISLEQASLYKNEVNRLVDNKQIASLLKPTKQVDVSSIGANYFVLIDPNNKITGARANDISTIEKFAFIADNPFKPQQRLFDTKKIIGPFSVDAEPLGLNHLLYFVRYSKPQSELLNAVFDNPLLIIFLIMLVVSPLLWWLVSSISGPIKHLQEAANQIALGNFKINKELEITGASEVRQVGESFNRMTEALEDLILSRQTLLSSISHELRTPLTRLQLSLSLLRRKVGEGKEIKRIQTEAERLDKMIKDLLSLSHQHLKSQLFREIIPISEFWDEIKENILFEAEQSKITCVYKQNIFYPAQYRVSANRESMASAMENVLRNAIKYAKSRIELTEYLGNGYFFICVDDDGEGIPNNEYENIFKPFYRVDPDNPNKKEGTGLGLAIVYNVAQQHRGSVWAESSPLGGLRVTLQLPLYKS